MFVFKYLIFLILITHLTTFLQSEIHAVTSMSEIEKWSDIADSNTLILFDMDYTLVMPKNPAFHRPVYKKYKDWRRELINSLTVHEKTFFSAVFITNGALSLVEQYTAQIIENLQNRCVPLIIFTSSSVGTIGAISRVEDWRYKELSRLGIDNSFSFVNKSPTQFDTLNSQRGNYPLFKNGILSTNGSNNTKGNVIKAFLELLDWKPTKVIFIDDELRNLNSVESSLSALGIPFIGLQYNGSEYVPCTEISEKTFKASWEDVIQKTKLIAHHTAPLF